MVYEINERTSKIITVLRFFAIVMVLYLHQYSKSIDLTLDNIFSIEGHYEAFTYIISRIITFCAVPTFFLISSILLYSKEFEWKNNMKKKVFSILIPYLLWTTIYILIYFIGQSIPITKKFFLNSDRNIYEMSFIDYLGAYLGYVGNGRFVNSLWFLSDLFILNLLAVVIKKIIDKQPLLWFIITVFLWFIVGINYSFILNVQSICFWSWGYYIVKYNTKVDKIDKLNFIYLIFIYIFVISLELYFYIVNSVLVIPSHGLAVILGILTILKISSKIIKDDTSSVPKLILYISKYSFFIYLLQDFIQTIFKKIASYIFSSPSLFVQLMIYILIPFVACIVCTLIAYIVEKIMPRVYNLLSGSRRKKRC